MEFSDWYFVIIVFIFFGYRVFDVFDGMGFNFMKWRLFVNSLYMC